MSKAGVALIEHFFCGFNQDGINVNANCCGIKCNIPKARVPNTDRWIPHTNV